MRALFRAIGATLRAMARATRTMVVWCARTGGWTVKTVVDVAMSPFAGGGGDAIPDLAVAALEAKASTSAVEFERVKRLAAGLASGHAPAEIFEDVPDQVVEWLTSMDSKMLCKIVCAKDRDLVAHLEGKQPMRGVLLFDKRAIEDCRAATIGASPDEPRPGYEPEQPGKPLLAS